MYIQEIGRIEAEPQGAAATGPTLVAAVGSTPATSGGPAGRAPGAPDADRAHARAAAAVRDAEGLVQVEVADVGAELGGPGQADQRVHVGAVHVDLPAVLVDDPQMSLIAASNTPCVEG